MGLFKHKCIFALQGFVSMAVLGENIFFFLIEMLLSMFLPWVELHCLV